ncbi:hypothetical protein [Cypionkella sp.]|uniref:hypothetical protein n=1 Tax=Cypionkella sp. TaxID=2811411 RepID=UPI00263519D3|nr:hypothetical protein [Cypionkella sp.]MDB5664532.1 hypothetical protein [Cypionkella sp.]
MGVIEGALQWRARGLEIPPSVAVASAEYFDDADIVGQFLADETYSVTGNFVAAKDLRHRFTQWTEAQNQNTWTQQMIVREIGARGFENVKTMVSVGSGG